MSTPAEQLPQVYSDPTEERSLTESMGMIDTTKTAPPPESPGIFGGLFDFNENTAYLGPIWHGLEGVANGAAKGELLLSRMAPYLAVPDIEEQERGSGLAAATPEEQRRAAQAVAESIRQDARERMRLTTPDAATAGFAAQTIHGVASGLARFNIGTLLGGTPGAAALLGGTEAESRYEELREQGVSTGAAGASAVAAGAFGAAGAYLPGGVGSSLAMRIASGAAINTGFGIASRGTDHIILSAAGYDHQAEQQRAWDGTSLLADAVLGSAFGLHGHFEHQAGEARAAERKAVLDALERLRQRAQQTPGAEDAARVTATAARDQHASPGVATDPGAANAHQRALETAITQTEAGEPVNVDDAGLDGQTFALRPDRDLTPAAGALVNAIRDGGLLDEERNLSALERTLQMRIEAAKGRPIGERARAEEGPTPATDEELEAMAAGRQPAGETSAEAETRAPTQEEIEALAPTLRPASQEELQGLTVPALRSPAELTARPMTPEEIERLAPTLQAAEAQTRAGRVVPNQEQRVMAEAHGELEDHEEPAETAQRIREEHGDGALAYAQQRLDAEAVKLQKTQGKAAQTALARGQHWGKVMQELGGQPLERPAATEPRDQLADAYHQLRDEQGAGTVSIADLQERTGMPLDQLHDLLRTEAKAGNLTLTRNTSTEPGQARTDAAGMEVKGLKGKAVAVVMKNPEGHADVERAGRYLEPLEGAPPKVKAAYDKATAKLQQDITGKPGETTAHAVLDSIAGADRNSPVAYLARYIKRRIEDSKVTIHPDAQLANGNVGDYNRKTGEITLARGASALTALHEMAHTAVSDFIAKNPAHPLVKELDKLFNHVKAGIADGHYGMTDIHEFLAEALTSPSFQIALARMKSPTGPGSVWNRLVNIIRRMLHVGPEGEENSALNHALKLADIISTGPHEKVPLRMRGSKPERADKAYIASFRFEDNRDLGELAVHELQKGNYFVRTLKDGTRVRVVHVRDDDGQNALVMLAPDTDEPHPFKSLEEAGRDASAWPRPDYYIGDLHYSMQDQDWITGGPGLRHNPMIGINEAHEGKGAASILYQEAERNGGLIPYETEKDQSRTALGEPFRKAKGIHIGPGVGYGGTRLRVKVLSPRDLPPAKVPEPYVREPSRPVDFGSGHFVPNGDGTSTWVPGAPSAPREVQEALYSRDNPANPGGYRLTREQQVSVIRDNANFYDDAHLEKERVRLGLSPEEVESIRANRATAAALHLPDPMAAPAQQALQERPDLTITGDNGEPVPAAQALEAAQHGATQGAQDAETGVTAAVQCALRRGE